MPLMVIFPVTFETCKKCEEIKIKIVVIEMEKFLLHESKARFHSTYVPRGPARNIEGGHPDPGRKTPVLLASLFEKRHSTRSPDLKQDMYTYVGRCAHMIILPLVTVFFSFRLNAPCTRP